MANPEGHARAFDGIICLGGEDWWYHNRGHFDFQIMRRLARTMPVLFVNSLGVRFPSAADPAVFVARIRRKLASLGRGLAHVEHGFHVLSPLSAPGRTGRLATQWALAPQIQLAARRVGIRNPLVWVHCPPGALIADALAPVGVVLQRTDRFEAFPEGDPTEISMLIERMKARADLVVYCNEELRSAEADEVRSSVTITHGVDFERFSRAGEAGCEPSDVAALPRPRAGFVGGLDAHTFDPALFNAVAGALPNVAFVLVGGSSLPERWSPHANVTMLGRKPYDEVADYMAACDVLIMPWNDSEWIRACNPIKLKEYLAVGRPVVTTDFPALAPFRDAVAVATTADAFIAAIRTAIAAPPSPDRLRALVREETWEAKAAEVLVALAARGLAPMAAGVVRSAA